MRSSLLVSVGLILFGCVIDADYSDEPLLLEPSVSSTSAPYRPTRLQSNAATPESSEANGPARLIQTEPNLSVSDQNHTHSCQLEMSWAKTSSQIFTHHGLSTSGLYDLMPNHPVVVGASVEREHPFEEAPLVAYRLEDGAPIFHLGHEDASGALDANWFTRAVVQSNESGRHLVVRPVLEAPEFWRLRLEDAAFNHGARFTPDGQSLVLVSCQNRAVSGESDTLVRQFRVSDGVLETSISIPEYCAHQFDGNLAIAEMTANGRHMLLASNHRFLNGYDPNTMVHVDLHRATFRRAASDLEASALADLELTPDGTVLFATAVDGRMRRWSFPTLEPLTDFTEVGVFSLGRRTYMPTDDSPITFSKTGAFIAYISPERDVVVARVESGEVVYRIDLTRFLHDDIMPNGNTGAEAASLRFTEDGAGLVIGLTSGLAVYRCVGAQFPPGRDNLSVLLDGPRSLRLGETAELTATHLDATHMHGHAFFVDGRLLSHPTTSRFANWTPDEAGVYEITVRLIDGVNVGEATLFVEVYEP